MRWEAQDFITPEPRIHMSIPSALRFRPPAVPLVTLDPFFSIWSCANRLTDDVTRHWTGAEQNITGLIRIDGKTLGVCGTTRGDLDLPAMRQIDLQVHPTRTIYTFESGGVRLTLTFLTPALPHDLEWLSRPVTYFIFDVVATDGAVHDVSLYWDVSGEIATDTLNDQVVWSHLRTGPLDVVSISSAEQRILKHSGDHRRIDWGHAYLALPAGAGTTHLGKRGPARKRFVAHGRLPAEDEFEQPLPVMNHWPAMVALLPFGQVSSEPLQRHFILAYDDLFSVEHLHRRLRPWWRRHGAGAAQLLAETEAAFPAILKQCADYDASLTEQLRARGGDDYARLCALAFRQCLAAHKLAADHDGSPVYFSKETSSNGCIDTVDVTYPSAPFFLALNPTLLQAQLDPVLAYASSPRWKFPFAPHDLGTYPLANGQVYGGGEFSEENQMPVEECGNMLILVAALALREDRPDYAKKWWPLLRQWAAYLEDKGLDPDNQLCTDDFAGHMAHNTNLSLKAIVALGAFARLAALVGEEAESTRVRAIAKDMAARWQAMADDGDHYRLAFDAPGTWSQKYNLVWDRLLGLDLFPPEVARKEVAFYRTQVNVHGLPLDNRQSYTKLDWIFWTASLTDNDDDFQALTAATHAWVSAGATRVPLTDWYETTGDGRMIQFQARSVVGGLFIRQLDALPAVDFSPRRTTNWSSLPSPRLQPSARHYSSGRASLVGTR